MEIINKFTENKGISLALGFFDGVHLGHQAVIKSAVDYAKKNGTKTAVITFQDHPCCFLYKLQPKYIIKRLEKIKLFENLGVDYLYFINFDKTISEMSADDYLKTLVKYFEPKAISTGFNHSFGVQKTGDSGLLKAKQSEYGYEYFEVPPVLYENEIISSTSIREKLAQGEIKTINKMMGHTYKMYGYVQMGNQLGEKLGYKTANIKYPDNLLEIGHGVYTVEVEYEGIKYNGVANYGVRPSIKKNASPILEVHILDFNKPIYGQKLHVSFIKKIRNEMKFSSMKELQLQIEKDIMS